MAWRLFYLEILILIMKCNVLLCARASSGDGEAEQGQGCAILNIVRMKNNERLANILLTGLYLTQKFRISLICAIVLVEEFGSIVFFFGSSTILLVISVEKLCIE